MYDEWMPTVKLPLTPEQFRQLPRNSAYRYEYLNGQAYLTPRARHYHARLPLRPIENVEPVARRPVRLEDFEALAQVFAAAFAQVQPYGSLDEATRLEAARQALERTRTGGDGPWIERASGVAEEDGRLLGAVFVTLLPRGDLREYDSYYWTETPPADCIEKRLGQPHLTWIFVTPLRKGHGVGTALLGAAVRDLLALGYDQLASTFLLGNDSSLLWHWRNGFELLPYPGSARAVNARRQQRLPP